MADGCFSTRARRRRARIQKGIRARCSRLGVSTSASLSSAPTPKEVLLGALPTSLRLKRLRFIADPLLALESTNPTPSPASSPLLEGKWRALYLSTPPPGPLPSPTREFALFLYNGGYSPGIFLLDVATKFKPLQRQIDTDLTLTIRDAQPRATIQLTVKRKEEDASAPATSSTSLGPSTFTLEEELECIGERGLRERYVSVSGKLGIGNYDAGPLTLPTQLRVERELYVSYLDEDLLVIREEGGGAEIWRKVDEEEEEEESKMQEVAEEGMVELSIEAPEMETEVEIVEPPAMDE